MSKRNQKKNQNLRQPNAPISPRSKNDVDIVIPVYGRFDLLTRCLDAIPESVENFSYQVFIFDNNSPPTVADPSGSSIKADQFYAELKQYCRIDSSKLHIFQSKTNFGFPVACNRAAMRGNGELIFFLNSDCIMHPGGIAQLIRSLQSDLIAGVAAPMLLFPPQMDMINSGFRDDRVLVARPEGKVQHIGLDTNITGDIIHILVGWSPNNPRVMKVNSAYAATGAALMTRRFLWNKIGGFWEGYGLGTWEDVDYCLTVRSLGYDIRIVPSAVGTHFTGATSITYDVRYPLNENKVKFLQRWGNRLQYTEWERW